MLDRVYFCGIHNRFIVWGSHAQIECSDDFGADGIFS